MNDTEQLIKEALGKVAERTPHPGPTLNALRRKRKRQRNNIFLIATAGMAAVAVLIFAGTIASDRYTPPGHNDAAAALMPTNGQAVTIKYTPHWLPDGYVETFRSVGDETTRVWVPSAKVTDESPLENANDPRVVLSKIKKLPDDLGKWQEVSVRGLKAWVLTFDDQPVGASADLVWQAQDPLRVTVRGGVADAKEAAMRIADSVRADAKLTYLAPFSLDGKAAAQIWGSSPYKWTALWSSEKFGVKLSTTAPARTEGTPVDVRGKKGAFVSGGVLVVQDSGLWLTVSGDASNTGGIVDAANRVQLQHMPHPDTIWIGRTV